MARPRPPLPPRGRDVLVVAARRPDVVGALARDHGRRTARRGDLRGGDAGGAGRPAHAPGSRPPPARSIRSSAACPSTKPGAPLRLYVEEVLPALESSRRTGSTDDRLERGGHRRRYGGRGQSRPGHAGGGAVRDDPRLVGDERVDRDGREGPRHHGHGDPDRDHDVHAGDGVVDDHRRQDGRDPRAQARVHDRVRDLRVRFVHDGALTEPRGVAVRLVVPRGRRRRAGDAGDRGAGGVELRQGASGRGPTASSPRAARSRSRSDR